MRTVHDLNRRITERAPDLRRALGWRWSEYSGRVLRASRFNRVHVDLGPTGMATVTGYVLEEVCASRIVCLRRRYLGANLEDAAAELDRILEDDRDTARQDGADADVGG